MSLPSVLSMPASTIPVRDVRTVCSYCGVGCGIAVTSTGEDGAQSVTRAIGDRSHPVNAGRLCTKGAAHVELLAAPGRMTTALRRPARGEAPVTVPVADAVADAGARLRAIVDEHGPDAVALYVSGQMSTEAQYLANKLVKGHLRGRHIESNSRLCMASAGTGYKQSLGADGPPGSSEDLDAADLFLVIGSNMADCHPILFLRMADRLKAGAKLIVVDPRRTATADRADLYLPIAPGTDLALLNGLLHLLVADGAVDEQFIADHTDGWESMSGLLVDYPPDRVAEITGLAEADIRTAARWIGEAGEWMTLWTMGLNQSTQGTWHTNAVCNLHLATGAICRPGSGPFSLTGQPNAMGGREMGYMGPGLPGQRVATSAEDRAFVEDVWQLEPGTIRAEAGTGTIDMYRAMADGDIKAAWIICTNPVASVANRRSVIAGLEAAELVVVQDVYADTATGAYADIQLPAALWVEAEGVFVGSDRTMNLVRRAAEPPGEAQPDWLLICRVAQAMGYREGFSFESSAEVFEEIRRFWNPQTGWDVRGVDYERLRQGPVQWPAPPDDAEDRHPIRYLNDGVSQTLHRGADGHAPRLAFATPSRRAQFLARPHLPPAELPDDAYPWVLNTGRLAHQWHTMTKTGRVAKLMRLNPEPFVELHPADAEAQGMRTGDLVEIASRRGRAVLPVAVSDRVRPGNVFAPFHWNDVQGELLTVNDVTSDAVDEASRQPAFKYAAVALRLVERRSDAASTDDGRAAADPRIAALRELVSAAPDRRLDGSERTWIAGFADALATMTPDAPPAVPASAPLGAAASAWLDGVLAALWSEVRTAPADPAQHGVLLVWGSQTGNAEDVALACAAGLKARGMDVTLRSMADVRPADLRGAETLLAITSTFGDGGPPDNAVDLWTRLSRDDTPRLDGLRFAVFGLGDSSYSDFCGHARALDDRLATLGATRLLDRTDSELDSSAAAAGWVDTVAVALGVSVSAPPAAAPPASKLFTRANPVASTLVGNELLSGAGSAKETRRIRFDVSDARLAYAAGDSLGVVCRNSAASVSEWLGATGLRARAVVEVDGRERFLDDALAASLDIAAITPRLLAFLAERSSDATLADLVRHDGTTRARYLWSMQAVDLLHAFPARADAQEWVDALPRLQPRQYSISSSPKTDPDAVELTVSVVRFETDRGIRRGGLCSTSLADAALGDRHPVYLQASSGFRPPVDADRPMIMVGPGTGVAPFRAFLHDRRADGHRGRNWLFFGEQHEATDFYYRDELLGMRDDGFLSRLDVAFSRDQRRKIYVQERMLEHGAELWRWLDDGAHFYVCGDATRMAKDVDEALGTILQTHGGMSADEADEYRRAMVASQRYARDVY